MSQRQPLSSSRSQSAGFYRTSGLSIVVSAIFFAAATVGFTYFASQNSSSSFSDYLYYIYNNAALLGLLAVLGAASVLLLIPPVIALGISLKERSMNYALVAVAVALAGAFTYLANVGSYLYFLDRASLFTQCTPCAANSYTAALGNQSNYYTFPVAIFLLYLSVLIFSVIMRSSTFKGGAAPTGLIASLIGLFASAGFIVSNSIFDYARSYDPATRNNVNSFMTYAGIIAVILYMVWTAIVGRKLLQLGQTERKS